MKMLTKKLILISLTIFCLLPLFAFGGRAPEPIVGTIKYYGNAPFEIPGFETIEGKVYSLDIEENSTFTLQDILVNQGHLLELTGKAEKIRIPAPNRVGKEVFIVSSWKRL